jgi:ankyrin repeat protein
MVPRDEETEASIVQMLAPASQNMINCLETRDSLTSLHMAVRNKKLHLVRSLVEIGADPLIPVSGQIGLLSEGTLRNSQLVAGAIAETGRQCDHFGRGPVAM